MKNSGQINVPACHMDKCRNEGTVTWALVPVCGGHWQDLWEETLRYYKNTIEYDERECYVQIAHMTVWGWKTNG